MRSLRVQLLVSHLSIVTLLVVVMAGAIVNFLHLSRSIDRILKDNYKSVVAAQDMKEALGRVDSAATFYLGGQAERARTQFDANTARFWTAYRTEASNITESGEKQIVDDIGAQFQNYHADVKELLFARPAPTAMRARLEYFKTLEPRYAAIEARAQDVLNVNQAAILRADRQARGEARQASRTSIAVTVGAFALALFFALRMIRMALNPLLVLARQAEQIGAGHLDGPVDLRRTDEVGALAAAFDHMRERLREARRNEEQRLHRAERMSDEALESLYDPVLVTDGTGRVVHMNPAAEEIFGPSRIAAGRTIEEVVSDPRIVDAVQRAVHEAAASVGESEGDYIPLLSSGTERTYRLRTTPMHDDDGSLLGAVAVLDDVTHLRHLDRMKNEFIGVASHELRTPVTSLLLAVQLMQEGAAGPLTPEQCELVAVQREDLERLQRMMRDLLDATRLEAGMEQPRLGPVDARELLDAAVSSVEAQAEAKGIALTVEGPAEPESLFVDRAQVTRVLINLLNNAVRHTPNGGRVTAGVQGGDAVTFRVEDTGVGIPAEYLPRIFERFVQVPGATRGGAGMGLSIAEMIVKAHGGTIGVTSRVGEGSTFTVTLPLPPRGDRKEQD